MNPNYVKDALAGAAESKPKKELKEIRTRKGHNAGYIHEHHFTHPEVHKPEEHISANQDAMVAHMLDHMGTPNPGEAEAEQGSMAAPAQTPDVGM